MNTYALRRFSTLPNISFSYGGENHARTHIAPLVNKYAATEVGSTEQDTEMTSYSDEEDDDMTESLEQEEETSTPNTSLPEPPLDGDKRQWVRQEDELEIVQNEDQNNAVDGKEEEALLSKVLTEWESDGGLQSVQAAFEGTFLLESSLDGIAEWCAPIVWKLFLRQALHCSASATHAHALPQDTPTPHFLPKLLTRAMPRYKGEMTRAIAVTHALLYLYRIKTCFHCSGSAASQQKLGQFSSNPGCGNGNTDSKTTITSNASNINTTVSTNPKGAVMATVDAETALRNLVIETASQCSLFFAVGMHYASLWLLDCCPSEKAYWKRYVHCVPALRGVAWSRLVLQHWNYRINVSVEDWLSFCSQLLAKFPVIDDRSREALQNGL